MAQWSASPDEPSHGASPAEVFSTRDSVGCSWCSIRKRLSTWCVGVWTVTRTRAFEPDVAPEHLADVDLLEGIFTHLGTRHLPSLTLSHNGNILFLTIGLSDRTVLSDLVTWKSPLHSTRSVSGDCAASH